MNELHQEADRLEAEGNALGTLLRWHRQAVTGGKQTGADQFGNGYTYEYGVGFGTGSGYGDGYLAGFGDGGGNGRLRLESDESSRDMTSNLIC